jgi:hypothetical protein
MATACCGGGQIKAMATTDNNNKEADIDYSLVPVLLEYVGPEGHYNEVVNGKTYSFSTAPMYRGVVVRQEDVPELMNRAKFKVASPWYKLPAKEVEVAKEKENKPDAISK